MNSKLRFWTAFALVAVYLVILAGAVVRTTGSGMGCPDWPKCFGYLIPPTERSQLDWKEEHEYKEGQVIIVEESLWVAKKDFTSSGKISEKNWGEYAKHDYATFNSFHTWTEFVNRLFGAFSGLVVLILGLFSCRYWKSDKKIVYLSWISVFGIVFQAWLGKMVVDSNLVPMKITIHMVMALVELLILLYLYFLSKPEESRSIKSDKKSRYLILSAFGLTLIQIAIGTQVRQFVDVQMNLFGEENSSLWLSNPNFSFYFHRSFSLIVVFLNVYLFMYLRKMNFGTRLFNWSLYIIGMEIVVGVLIYYADFFFMSQPLHLILAIVLFSIQFYYILHLSSKNKILISNDL